MNHWRLIIAVLFVSACQPEQHSSHRGFELTPIDTFESATWTGTVKSEDPVVATVEGTPITLSMLKSQLDRAPEPVTPKIMLNRMIEMELLARAAFKQGKYTNSAISDPVKKALAHTWIRREMKENLTTKDIPNETLKSPYEAFRARYDHFERFIVADVQLLCCTDVSLAGCFASEFDTITERRVALSACLSNHAANAEKLRLELALAKSLEEFKTTFERLKIQFPSEALKHQYNTEYKFHKYGFQYDIRRTYEDQFQTIEYRQLFKEVMDGVKNAYLKASKEVPFMTPAIRSPIGWHIIFVHEVHPEKHWKLDNPFVQQELRDRYFDRWRAEHFFTLTNKMCEKAKCKLAPERLEPLQRLDDMAK